VEAPRGLLGNHNTTDMQIKVQVKIKFGQFLLRKSTIVGKAMLNINKYNSLYK